MDHFHVHGPLAQGPRSSVFKAREKRALLFVALKRTPIALLPTLRAEVELHASVPRHPHVLQFRAWYCSSRNVYRVYELAAGGSLAAVIASDGGCSEGALRLFGGDLVHGLLHLHSHGVAVGTIRPAGVLLCESGTLKLSGLQGARNFTVGGDETAVYTPAACPLAYSAPELVRAIASAHGFFTERSEGVGTEAAVACGDVRVCPSSDLWSLGVCLWEAATGSLPWKTPTACSGSWSASQQSEALARAALLQDILHRPLPRPEEELLLPDPAAAAAEAAAAVAASAAVVPTTTTSDDIDAPAPPLTPRTRASPELSHLLSRLLTRDPQHRCTWKELLTHPFWRVSVTPRVDGRRGDEAAETVVPFPEAALRVQVPFWEVRAAAAAAGAPSPRQKEAPSPPSTPLPQCSAFLGPAGASPDVFDERGAWSGNGARAETGEEVKDYRVRGAVMGTTVGEGKEAEDDDDETKDEEEDGVDDRGGGSMETVVGGGLMVGGGEDASCLSPLDRTGDTAVVAPDALHLPQHLFNASAASPLTSRHEHVVSATLPPALPPPTPASSASLLLPLPSMPSMPAPLISSASSAIVTPAPPVIHMTRSGDVTFARGSGTQTVVSATGVGDGVSTGDVVNDTSVTEFGGGWESHGADASILFARSSCCLTTPSSSSHHTRIMPSPHPPQQESLLSFTDDVLCTEDSTLFSLLKKMGGGGAHGHHHHHHHHPSMLLQQSVTSVPPSKGTPHTVQLKSVPTWPPASLWAPHLCGYVVAPIAVCARPPPLRPDLLPTHLLPDPATLLDPSPEGTAALARHLSAVYAVLITPPTPVTTRDTDTPRRSSITEESIHDRSSGSGASARASPLPHTPHTTSVVDSHHTIQLAAMAHLFALGVTSDICANAILNSNITHVLLSLLTRSSSGGVQARAGLVLGALLQNATVLSPALLVCEHRSSGSGSGGGGVGALPYAWGLLGALAGCVGMPDELRAEVLASTPLGGAKEGTTAAPPPRLPTRSAHALTRQAAVGAMAELIFFCATQAQDEEEGSGGGEGPCSPSSWRLPPWTITFLSHTITRDGSDTDAVLRRAMLKCVCSLSSVAPHALIASPPHARWYLLCHAAGGGDIPTILTSSTLTHGAVMPFGDAEEEEVGLRCTSATLLLCALIPTVIDTDGGAILDVGGVRAAFDSAVMAAVRVLHQQGGGSKSVRQSAVSLTSAIVSAAIEMPHLITGEALASLAHAVLCVGRTDEVAVGDEQLFLALACASAGLAMMGLGGGGMLQLQHHSLTSPPSPPPHLELQRLTPQLLQHSAHLLTTPRRHTPSSSSPRPNPAQRAEASVATHAAVSSAVVLSSIAPCLEETSGSGSSSSSNLLVSSACAAAVEALSHLFTLALMPSSLPFVASAVVTALVAVRERGPRPIDEGPSHHTHDNGSGGGGGTLLAHADAQLVSLATHMLTSCASHRLLLPVITRALLPEAATRLVSICDTTLTALTDASSSTSASAVPLSHTALPLSLMPILHLVCACLRSSFGHESSPAAAATGAADDHHELHHLLTAGVIHPACLLFCASCSASGDEEEGGGEASLIPPHEALPLRDTLLELLSLALDVIRGKSSSSSTDATSQALIETALSHQPGVAISLLDVVSLALQQQSSSPSSTSTTVFACVTLLSAALSVTPWVDVCVDFSVGETLLRLLAAAIDADAASTDGDAAPRMNVGECSRAALIIARFLETKVLPETVAISLLHSDTSSDAAAAADVIVSSDALVADKSVVGQRRWAGVNALVSALVEVVPFCAFVLRGNDNAAASLRGGVPLSFRAVALRLLVALARLAPLQCAYALLNWTDASSALITALHRVWKEAPSPGIDASPPIRELLSALLASPSAGVESASISRVVAALCGASDDAAAVVDEHLSWAASAAAAAAEVRQ